MLCKQPTRLPQKITSTISVTHSVRFTSNSHITVTASILHNDDIKYYIHCNDNPPLMKMYTECESLTHMYSNTTAMLFYGRLWRFSIGRPVHLATVDAHSDYQNPPLSKLSRNLMILCLFQTTSSLSSTLNLTTVKEK